MSSHPAGHRRSIRLPGYDYAQTGAYFVTLCTYQGEELFGQVADAGMILSAYGRIAHDAWLASPAIRPEIALDAFCVMPNHVHGIVAIVDGACRGARLAPDCE